MGAGQRIISDNNPSLEYYLDMKNSSAINSIEKIMMNRVSYEDIWEKSTKPSLILRISFLTN